MVMVFFSTVFCSQVNIMLEKQKTLFKLFTVTIMLFQMQLHPQTEKIRTFLENKLKELKVNLKAEDNIQCYNICKRELDSIYDHIAEGTRTQSKCNWYEPGEKIFLILKRILVTNIRFVSLYLMKKK